MSRFNLALVKAQAAARYGGANGWQPLDCATIYFDGNPDDFYLLSQGESKLRMSISYGRSRLARIPKLLILIDVAPATTLCSGFILPDAVCPERYVTVSRHFTEKNIADEHVARHENPCHCDEG